MSYPRMMTLFYSRRGTISNPYMIEEARMTDPPNSTEDIILTVTRTPFELYNKEHKTDSSCQNTNPAPSELGLLDAQNIDYPVSWIPLHVTAKGPYSFTSHFQGSSDRAHQNSSQSSRCNKSHKLGGGRMKGTTPCKSVGHFFQEESAITMEMSGTTSYPETFYPIYLPMDQEYKAKYIVNNKRGRTIQEKVFFFLEHPYGFLCFSYHILR